MEQMSCGMHGVRLNEARNASNTLERCTVCMQHAVRRSPYFLFSSYFFVFFTREQGQEQHNEQHQQRQLQQPQQRRQQPLRHQQLQQHHHKPYVCLARAAKVR